VGVFLAAALAISGVALVTRSMAFARRDLERQSQDLGGLQAVGRVLSHSLELDKVLQAIYQQVCLLMPSESFYIAMYEPDTDEITFPLAVENGAEINMPPRRGGRGLIETILHTRIPMRNRQTTDVLRRRLGIDNRGRPPTSWLGVPIMAGDQVLGVLAVQSFSVFDLYDEEHEQILSAIASQAAVAIQNARLYARTDEALARKMEEMTSILRTVDEGICLLDKNGKILSINSALADYLGDDESNLVGKNLFYPGTIQEKSLLGKIGYAAGGLQKDIIALENEETEVKVCTIEAVNYREEFWERTTTPVRDLEGRISGWLIVLRNITDEIKLTQMREDMLHMLVHDLRSPLTVIMSSFGALRKLLLGVGGEEVDRLIGLSQKASQKLLRMVNLMLDVSKLEEGELTLEREWHPLKPLLGESAEQFYPSLRKANLNLDVRSDGEMIEVFVDKDHMDRVLTNLLDNAIKFTPDGGHIILWSRMEMNEDAPSLLIGVSDDGPGLPEESRQRVFQKYHQHQSIQGRRAGTGLGLYYCKLVVEAHGGEIGLESKNGKGSTFKISLPSFRKMNS
jgi:K+-sensing histidine kinase KdpD